MKKLYILILISIAFISCDDDKDDNDTNNSITGEYRFKEVVELEKSVYVEGGRKLNSNEIPESINDIIKEYFYEDTVVDSNLVLVLTESHVYEKGNESTKLPYTKSENTINIIYNNFVYEYIIDGNNLEQHYSLYTYITTDSKYTAAGANGVNGSFDDFLAENEINLPELGVADTVVHFRIKGILSK